MQLIKNKKGFMFVETIITMTVLTTILLLLYTSFTSLLNKERTITSYNKKGHVYALNSVKEYLLSCAYDFNLGGNISIHLTSEYIAAKSLCNKDEIIDIFNLYNIIQLNINSPENHNCENCSVDMQNFVKSIPAKNISNTVNIFGKFSDPETNVYYYAFIRYPNVEV